MVQHYGDLLKVSRTRGISHTLPKLREYVKGNPWVIEEYRSLIESEIEGQGLVNNAVLCSYLEAQIVAFEQNESKNNTVYAAEMKKIISDGAQTKDKEFTPLHKEVSEDLVQQILESPLEVDVSTVTTEVANRVREKLMDPEQGFREFSKWCFQIQMGSVFQEQDFHQIIFDGCQKVINGEIDRLIVTIPPRHSKTQILSIFLPLYSFCHNPTAHNIITSYGDDIVAESSGYIRQIMTDDLFQKIFPTVRIDPAKRSLERWGTTKSGVMHAIATGGKMTGKGAGSLAPVYSGVFVVDDAIKPKDAYSNAVRTEINDRFDNTFMSRLANDGVYTDKEGVERECARTPMVIIMQRVHDDDLVGYLLRGNSTDKYVWMNIPGIVTPECGTQDWYDSIIKRQAYTHAVPYLYDLGRGEGESALWPSRKSLESLRAMRKANPYTFNSQYMGDPSAKGTGVIKEEWWREFDTIPVKLIRYTFMTGDTASTSKTYSDPSVLMFWGVTKDQRLLMLDATIGKWETPELKLEIERFWKKHRDITKWPGRYQMRPRALYLEDKSSGQFLNQQFARDGKVRTLAVPRDKSGPDKFARFLNTVPYFAAEQIEFLAGHQHLPYIQREVFGMTSLGSGTGNDDVCDNIADAAVIAFANRQANYQDWV